MNKKNLLSTLILLIGIMLSIAGNAQNIQDSIETNPLDTIAPYDIFNKLSETTEGKVILGSEDVKSIINEMKAQKIKPLKGYRVRVFRDNGQAASRRAESIKSEVEKAYPGVPVYVKHFSPNFYVDVGDYRTQDDAEKMRRILIAASFAGAGAGVSLIYTDINFPTL
jgi:hypothetical protein